MKPDPAAARVEHVQGLLLPLSPRQVCDHLRLDWWAAAQLHQAGLLSFDPATTEKLDERQEVGKRVRKRKRVKQ